MSHASWAWFRKICRWSQIYLRCIWADLDLIVSEFRQIRFIRLTGLLIVNAAIDWSMTYTYYTSYILVLWTLDTINSIFCQTVQSHCESFPVRYYCYCYEYCLGDRKSISPKNSPAWTIWWAGLTWSKSGKLFSLINGWNPGVVVNALVSIKNIALCHVWLLMDRWLFMHNPSQ